MMESSDSLREGIELSENRSINKLIVGVVIGFVILLGGSLTWNILTENNNAVTLALKECSTSFRKDMLYRTWSARHGGVYAPVSENTSPNPYLDFLPDRDVVTGTGKKLTLINPAYMTRQVFELGKNEFKIFGHIASLNPLQPGNLADLWEMRALEYFEKGCGDVFNSIERIGGEEYMRYMRPMKIVNSCLKCHADQGYNIGDVKGGISVTLPMKKHREQAQNNISRLVFSHFIILLVVLVLMRWGYVHFNKEFYLRLSFQNRLIENEKFLKSKNNELLLVNEELDRSKKKAEESDKLKSAFLANMSHEIRTPLNAVIGFSDILRSNDLDKELRSKYIDLISSGGEQLMSIISDIIDFSKIEANQIEVIYERFDVNKLIDDIYHKFLICSKNENVVLKTNIPSKDSELMICSDDKRIAQILSNLLENAQKFTSKGEIEIGYELQESYIKFFVKDTGIGIHMDDHSLIFNRFRQVNSTTTKNISGTGLGLSIAKGLVEKLNGTIWIESEINKGATFFFTIPIHNTIS